MPSNTSQRRHLICTTTGCAQFKVRKISILFTAHFQEHQDVCILLSLLLLTLIIPGCNAVPVNSISVISYVVSVHLPTSPRSPSPPFLHWAFITPDFWCLFLCQRHTALTTLGWELIEGRIFIFCLCIISTYIMPSTWAIVNCLLHCKKHVYFIHSNKLYLYQGQRACHFTLCGYSLSTCSFIHNMH